MEEAKNYTFKMEDFVDKNEFFEGLSLKEFEDFTKSMCLDLISFRDEKRLSEKNNLPVFNKTLQKLVSNNKTLPTAKELYYEYRYVDNKKFFDKMTTPSDDFYKGLEGRCQRAYVSLCRDMYLALLLKKVFKDSKVIQTYELDTKYKIDILMEYNNKFYGLCVFLNTERGRKYFIYKQTREEKPIFDNVIYCSIPIDLHKWVESDVLLPTEKKDIKRFIEKYLVN